ncbi:hypothetical protein [Campylobacter volucris]|uniref:hypothetical protein n=1 Tax=Campylobacter volucris TaxID=1031542 RepID=UPI001FB8191A|nr:hypothetical protein [Campylobacter volucris]
MKYISKFIDNFKNGLNGFKRLNYDYKQYNCEMSDLNKMVNETNIQGIIDFWKKKQEYDFFEMKHPLYNNILTRAVFSIADDVCNYIFFIDKSNRYIWCGIQGDTIFNKFVVDNVIYEVYPDWRIINFDLLLTIGLESLKYQNVIFGFRLGSTYSMWHYFYESLCYAYAINIKKLIQNSPYLFLPNNKQTSIDEHMVFFQPNCTAFFNIDKKKEFLGKLGKFVYKDSYFYIKQFKSYNETYYDLTIWLSLVYTRADKAKTWIEQIEGSINIINELKKIYNKIKIYIDGFKSYENFPNFNNNASKMIDNFIAKINANFDGVDIINLNGISIKEAICICSNVDIAIAECGSGAIIPVLCCRKPAVLYGNNFYIEHYSVFCLPDDNVKIVESQYVKSCIDEYAKKSSVDYFNNYHIPWQHIYNKIVEILQKLDKYPKMDYIKVPSVELIAEQYKLQEKLGIEISLENVALYYEIQKQIHALNLSNNIPQNMCDIYQTKHGTAKQRIQNQLSYKLGQAMIINSKSLFGYIKMPFVLSYIKDKHKQEQKIYQEKIKKDPSLKLPPLEEYPDYKEALKEKECLTYKLGQALIKANKTWHKGGYVKLWFEIVELKKRRL